MSSPSFRLGLSQTLQFNFVLKMEDYMLSCISAYIYLKSCWIFIINTQPIQLSSLQLPCHSMYNHMIYTFLKYRHLYAYYSIMPYTHTHTHTGKQRYKSASINMAPDGWLTSFTLWPLWSLRKDMPSRQGEPHSLTEHKIYHFQYLFIPCTFCKKVSYMPQKFYKWGYSYNAYLGELDMFVTWQNNKYSGNLEEKEETVTAGHDNSLTCADVSCVPTNMSSV
jgi:hypothetical protein